MRKHYNQVWLNFCNIQYMFVRGMLTFIKYLYKSENDIPFKDSYEKSNL